MKKKKVVIGIEVIIVTAIIGMIVGMVIVNQQNEKQAKEAITSFFQQINEKNYDGMYEKVASMNMSKEDFITRNKNIYEGIDATDVKVEINEIKKENNEYTISYEEKMYTSAGEIKFSNKTQVVKENKTYKLKWSSSMIFPQLGETDKVRVSTIASKRGEILDRNGEKLAANGQIASVGIVPGKLGENKEDAIANISKLTGVSTEYINQQLNASYVKEDTFVPIKKISDSNTELKNQLVAIPGILINKVNGRVYPFGKAASHLIGYVQAINAEELEANEGKGYHTNSVIGKSGLEKAYEDTLRGIDGAEIYITDANGNKVKQLVKQDKKDGEDIKLTIDSKIQNETYEQMKNDKGFFVIMEPQTGELLALVSTPTFDSNDFVVGMTTEQWNTLNNDTNKPLYNRFLQKYAPGSTFKPVTGAIGITTGKTTAEEDFGYTGTSWQKDASWGNYKITTLTGYNGAKNLLNGMIHSDNIYFAQTALKIGAETYAENLNKIGFNETIEFPLSLAKSQYANNNGNTIDSETKLADSGYGQGSILVNPIHMASIYSAFANQGNMIQPTITDTENTKGKIAKEKVFSEEAATTIQNALIQVVENKEGTANDMKMPGVTIAGKTGTAELKTSSEDTESGTLGWFDCYTINRTNGSNVVIISMVENTQNNSDGGSHYLIKKIKNILQ